MNNFIIGCVGKPSSGKSSFLNSVTEANAKVGNFFIKKKIKDIFLIIKEIIHLQL